MAKDRNWHVILTVLLMDFIFILLLHRKYTFRENYNQNIENLYTTVVSQVDKSEILNREQERILDSESIPEYQGEQVWSLIDVFQELIIGQYKISDDLWLEFSADGKFSGFFDFDNPDVSDYDYDIDIVKDIPYINIYNKEKTKRMTYELVFTDKLNILMIHKDSRVKIELKK